VACLLKAITVKPAETAIAREWLCKHIVPMAKKEHATMEELLEVVFSVQSVPRLYKESALSQQFTSAWGLTAETSSQSMRLV
jgi:hypothetical protein